MSRNLPKSELIKDAINGMLQSLDPHSSYLDLKELNAMRTSTSGKFGGLGIEVTMENDLVKVIAPMDDTPAAKAGVIAGDLISQIDGIGGLSLGDAVEKMRGLIDTPIVLTVLREGADKPLQITIVRDELPSNRSNTGLRATMSAISISTASPSRPIRALPTPFPASATRWMTRNSRAMSSTCG